MVTLPVTIKVNRLHASASPRLTKLVAHIVNRVLAFVAMSVPLKSDSAEADFYAPNTTLSVE